MTDEPITPDFIRQAMAELAWTSVCGGCRGEGRHARWCPKVVGMAASRLGRMAEEAEAMGDRIGSNNVAAANLAYALSGALREDATARAHAFQTRTGQHH